MNGSAPRGLARESSTCHWCVPVSLPPDSRSGLRPPSVSPVLSAASAVEFSIACRDLQRHTGRTERPGGSPGDRALLPHTRQCQPGEPAPRSPGSVRAGLRPGSLSPRGASTGAKRPDRTVPGAGPGLEISTPIEYCEDLAVVRFCPVPQPLEGADLRFGVGDYVVYPNHGVGVVEDVKQTQVAGVDQAFYHLRLLANESTVMVPVGNSKSVGLRKIFGKTQIRKLFLHLREPEFETQGNWKGRYKENAEKMRSGHLFEMADVLKNLQHLSQRKALSYREKRMYEKAKQLIVSEVAMVQGREVEKVESLVEVALDECLEARKVKRKRAKSA